MLGYRSMKCWFPILLLVASPLAAEDFIWPLGNSGIVKGDLSIQLYEDGAPVADPGITITEQPNGRDYEFAALPDPAPGSSTAYVLTWEYLGVPGSYAWPLGTRTPQAVEWRQVFRPSPSVWEMGVGDTAIPGQLEVEGLASDPTGSGVTFSMRKRVGGTVVVDEAAATLADVTEVIDPVTLESTWTAVVTYDFVPADTATAGEYRAWFTITYPGGGVMTAPPAKDIQVAIYR